MQVRLRSWWQKIKQHSFIATGIIIVLIALIAFIFAVLKFGWDWTGFTSGASKITITSTSKGTTTSTELQPARTLWDWLGLLAALAIPIVVGFGAAWFTAQQGKASDRENTENQRETRLQAYLDRMTELLLKEGLRASNPDDEVQKIARVRTLTTLCQLDAYRNAYVLRFLRETGLVNIDTRKSIIDLTEADLSEVKLSKVNLSKVNLSGAKLSGANLSGADLTHANLSSANLYGADLANADFSQADLKGADLRETKVTEEQLKKAKSLVDVTMPDGSKHP
jgi:hypothetical protein